MTEEDIWKLEERFWLEGSSVYDAHLDSACVMAFPGIGVMTGSGVMESLKNAPRWASVHMSERVAARAWSSVIVLGYKAEGRRPGAEPYLVFCTSTYRADGSTWRLVQHQQTLAR
jgi:hypothetical protein